eukprot:Em0007g589a
MATQQDRCYTSSASFPGYRPGHLSNELDNSGDCQRERSLSTDIRTIITGGFDDVSCLADAGRRNHAQADLMEQQMGGVMKTAKEEPHELCTKKPASKDRAKVLEEILDSERAYVGHLRDIVGEAKFSGIYVEYYNNHPHSVHMMDSLESDEKYALFFESCRLLANLHTSLDSYLLAPLHRIGTYPILLSELLRCTSDDHPDYRDIATVIEMMKGVIRLINEHKRRLETVADIAQWQETIANWKGEDIYEKSTELLHSEPLHKISKGHSQERHFFLFDHQIVYCKKDAIGGKLAYKGRLYMERTEIIDLQDGTEIKHAWKMSNRDKDKWYVLYARSAAQKKEWIDAFQKERKRVKEDAEKGFCISCKTKKAAIALHKDTSISQKKNVHKINAPSAPIGLKADRICSTSVLLSWVAPQRLNGTIRGYQVSFTTQGEPECLLDVEETTSTELTSLKPHTEYIIRVRAKTADYGDYSIPITLCTSGDDILTKLSSILDSYQNITFKELKIAKLIFYGTPRTGKTTLRRFLVDDDRIQSAVIPEPSTNIAEMSDLIYVERIVVTGERRDEWKWTVQGLDDIAKTLLQCLDSKLHNREVKLAGSVYANKGHSNFGKNIKKKRHLSHSLSALSSSTQAAVNVPEFPQQVCPSIRKGNRAVFLPTHQSHLSTQHNMSIDIKQLFLEAVNTGKWSEVVSALHILDKAMLIQIIDGGGQPSFQEIFPLLISGPSVTLLMFKLTDDLEQPYPVMYQPNDNASEHNWQDTYTVKDVIFHALSNLVLSQPDAGKILKNHFHSKVVLVGTHKDKLQGSEDEKMAAIEHCAQSIHSWLCHSKAFKSIDVKKVADLVTGINNFDSNDIKKMKKKIETLISQRESQNIPAPWLVFDFVLRKYAILHQMRKVEKAEYKEIAKLCGIKNDEISTVLHYLHHVAGTLLHYPDISELNHCVITDFQLIFDSVSKIIIQYFESSAHLSDRDLLHKKGQFEASVLQADSCCLNVSELLALLQHRHIVSALGEGSFFMPSVLPKAKTEPSSADSCSFLVMFEYGCCPVGLFCAATTRLIIIHKWEVNKSEQFRNKISFHHQLAGNWYIVIFTAFSAHYEVKLVDADAPAQVKLEVYKAVNEVFNHICRDLQSPPPIHGFYCPATCTYDGATYLQYQHPAKCAFSCKAQQMKCYYSDRLSMLTEEHKMWFQEKVHSHEQKRTLDLNLRTLLAFPGKSRTFNLAAELGLNYIYLGVFLLKDTNCITTHALEAEHMKKAENINRAILSSWLQGRGLPVTWDELIAVIRQIKCYELAAEMEDAL